MSALKSKIQASIKSGKINKFILFLIVSFIILLLSKLSKDYTKVVSFNVEIENLPEEQVIIKDSTHKIDILLKTYGFKLMRYYLSSPKLTVDLEKIQNIQRSYIWTATNNAVDVKNQFAENVEVENILTDSIIFSYDVNYVKKVPVILSKKVNFAPGYNVKENYALNPDSVRLIGPRVIVDAIDEVITDSLIMENVKNKIDVTLGLKLPNQIETIAMSSKRVNVLGNVDKFTEGTVQVPIVVTNLPDNMNVNYFPKKVSVVFNTALSNYESISANDFRIECNFTELSNESSFLVPRLTKKPEIAKSIKINQTRIEFIISE